MTKFLIAFTAALLLAMGAAHAQSQCAPYALIVKAAMDEYKEAPMFEYDIASGDRIVGLVSSETHTVTLFAVRRSPDGMEIACQVSAGENFRTPLSVKPPGRPS